MAYAKGKWGSKPRTDYLESGKARSNGLPPPREVDFLHEVNDPVEHAKVRNQASQQIKAPSPVDFMEHFEQPGDENVLMAHPEATQIFTRNYNARDPYLSDNTERMDDTYVSPEIMRLRTKYGTRF